ncbi:S41 family peptidase [Flavihumibacter stibioxidans]|uniref:Tail specific protease domain-containing protein n=1 Tax=Flavihumibacter stibioxidans TaxID=1834163 RepID=A0ABR7MCV5_9BACT|nr:S41 family peptidase [Flavihumibacter stibioxidans]MBC6492802.1 hypothetical protein [Flavihumibacter stibioxidans]
MKKIMLLLALAVSQYSIAQDNTDSTQVRKFTVAELQRDLDSLYGIISANHPDLYRFADRYETGMAWEEAKATITHPMTRWEFIGVVAPLVNMFRDGHTNLSFDFESEEVNALVARKGRLFPFRVRVQMGEVWLLENWTGKQTELKNKQLVSINEVPVGKLLEQLIPVTAGDYDDNIEANLSRLFSFMLWSVYGWEDSFQVSIADSKGKLFSVGMEGLPIQDWFNIQFPKKDWSMQVYEKQGLAVIECRSYRNEKQAKAFIDSAFAEIAAKKIRHLAFDIRRNGGGNSVIGDYFLSYITRKPYTDVVGKTISDGSLLNRFKQGSWVNNMLVRYREEGIREGKYLTRDFSVHEPDSVRFPGNHFDGKFYLLTSPATYSSAHMTALAVKCYQIGTILGEPTGERINLTGESIGFELPNTKLHGYCATAVYKAACGNPDQPGVQPDISIPFDRKAASVGKDPVKDYLMEKIARKP